MDQLLNQQDMEFEATKRKELQHLLKDKENIERLLDAYTEAESQKVDIKSKSQIDMFVKEKESAEQKLERERQKAEDVYESTVRRAADKRDKDISLATSAYEKYRDYCNGHITRLGGSTETPCPERIIRRKKELDIINAKLFYVQSILKNWELVNQPDYVPKVVLPAKTWVPSSELLAEEKRVMELRMNYVPEPEY